VIPAKPSNAQRRKYVANIVAAYHSAPESARRRGEQWYPVARDLAFIVGAGDARKGAGVIAALSPNKSWKQNIQLAKDAGNGHVHGHVSDALRKVAAILEGADPEDVLPMSSKTGHFFRCIFDPADPDPVVVDRHAHDVAVGKTYGNAERGLGAAGRYAALAHAYRVAAVRLELIPQTLQAIAWCAQVDSLAGIGFRGSS